MKKYVLILGTFDVLFQQCFNRDHCVYGFSSRKKNCVSKGVFVHVFLYMVSFLGIQSTQEGSKSIKKMIHFDFPYIIFAFEVGGFTHHFCLPEKSFMMFYDVFLLVIVYGFYHGKTPRKSPFGRIFLCFSRHQKSKSKLLNGIIIQTRSYPSSLDFC